MKKRALSGKTRLKKRNRRMRMIKFSILGFCIFCIIVGLAIFSRSERARIQTIIVTGNNLVSVDELKRIAGENTASALLGIFKKDNSVLYPKKQVEEDILDHFKSIKKVDVSFKSANTLEIDIVERKAAYLWCASPAEALKNCFFMDDAGFIFSEAPVFSGNVFFIYYGLLDSRDIVGKTYLSRDSLKSLKTFIESIKTLGANPVGLFAYSSEDYELILSPSAKIIFNTKTDFLKTFENLSAIVKERERTEGKGGFFKNLSHIDLRFGSKAFFKMK